MKLASLLAILKALLEFLGLWQRRRAEEEGKKEALEDVQMADQAEALRVERINDTVPRELPADAKPARRGRRPSPVRDPASGDD